MADWSFKSLMAAMWGQAMAEADGLGLVKFADLKEATEGWTVPVLVRSYGTKKEDERKFQDEARVLALHDYDPEVQAADGGHIHAGRLLLTGGLSIFAGRSGIRSKGKLTVTYKKVMTGGPRAHVVVDGVKRGFVASSRSKLALAEFTDEDVMRAELPARILIAVPESRAEAVVAHLARSGVTARIERPTGQPDGSPEADANALDTLGRLAALHEQGALTDEEFSSKKADILAKLG